MRDTCGRWAGVGGEHRRRRSATGSAARRESLLRGARPGERQPLGLRPRQLRPHLRGSERVDHRGRRFLAQGDPRPIRLRLRSSSCGHSRQRARLRVGQRHRRGLLRGPERRARERRQAVAHLELEQLERRRELADERLRAKRPGALQPALDRPQGTLAARHLAMVLGRQPELQRGPQAPAGGSRRPAQHGVELPFGERRRDLHGVQVHQRDLELEVRIRRSRPFRRRGGFARVARDAVQVAERSGIWRDDPRHGIHHHQDVRGVRRGHGRDRSGEAKLLERVPAVQHGVRVQGHVLLRLLCLSPHYLQPAPRADGRIRGREVLEESVQHRLDDVLEHGQRRPVRRRAGRDAGVPLPLRKPGPIEG